MRARSHPPWIVLLLLAGGTLVAPDARAAEDAAEEPAAAVRVRGQAPARSASSVVRGREVIEAAPHRTASDLLRLAPGLFVTQHSGEGKAHQIFLRGFDAVHGQDLELWVGGIPVNEVSNIHGQGYADLHFVMPEVVREVVSTPGAYDPRQGDFAIAGTIRMQLGYAEPGVTAKGQLGSFGGRRWFLGYRPEGASEETFAAFENYATDGFGPNRAARRTSFVGQATHAFASGLTLRALTTLYAGTFDAAGVVRVTDVDAGRLDRFATYDPKQGGASSRAQVLVELRKETEEGRFSVAPFFTLRDLSLRQNFTGYFVDGTRSGRSVLESDNNQQLQSAMTLGATASYRKPVKLFSSADAIEVGFFGRNDWIEQSQRRLSEVDDRPTEVLVDARVRATNVAGYADASLRPLRRVVLRGGVRVDGLAYAAQDRVRPGAPPEEGLAPRQERTAQGAHVGKKATADVAIARGLHAVASYGDGFRSPQARSLSQGERTPFARARGVEGGLRFAEGGALAGSVAAFHTTLSRDLVFDPVTARNEDVPGTHRNGATAEVTFRPAPWFVQSSNVTYTDARFTGSDGVYGEGDVLPYVPQIVARADMAFKAKLARLAGRVLEGRIGTGLEALARRPLPYGSFGKNVFLVDASAGLRLREVELALDVFNVLDAYWFDGQFVYASNFDRAPSPSLIPAQHVTVGPPRTVFLSLAVHL